MLNFLKLLSLKTFEYIPVLIFLTDLIVYLLDLTILPKHNNIYYFTRSSNLANLVDLIHCLI